MIKQITCLTIILYFFYSAPIFAATVDVDSIVMPALSKMKIDYHIPGVYTAIYLHGKPYTYKLGVANVAKNTPITKDTIFELGSITKLMTAILLAQEVDRAKISLDTPVNKYLTDLPANLEKVTFKNLATFTVNFPMTPPVEISNRKQLNQYLGKLTNLNIGEVRKYSNISIGLLGEALEVVNHRNLNQLYRERILTPLHMQPIALMVPAKYISNMAQGYTRNDDLALPSKNNLFPAAYGMKASGEDMQKFLQLAIGLTKKPDSLFYPLRMTQQAYVEVPEEFQGLVWKIYELDGDGVDLLLDDPSNTANTEQYATFLKKPHFFENVLLDKSGTTDGFRAYIAVIPKYESGIVILVNKNVPDEAIAKTAREIILNITGISKL